MKFQQNTQTQHHSREAMMGGLGGAGGGDREYPAGGYWGCVGDAVYGAMGPSMQVCQGLEEPWVVPPQMEGADMMGW